MSARADDAGRKPAEPFSARFRAAPFAAPFPALLAVLPLLSLAVPRTPYLRLYAARVAGTRQDGALIEPFTLKGD